MKHPINVAMTLKSSAQVPAVIAEIEKIAQKLGFQTTTTGRASISFRTDPETFQRVFGVAARPVSPQPAGDDDFGAQGGYVVDTDLNIPEELQQYVETIGVMPPSRRFGY